MNHLKVRNFLHTGREIPLDIADHLDNCVQCQEYAEIIGLLASELPVLWPETVPPAISVNRLMDQVQKTIRVRQPRQRMFRFGQEMGWLGIAILFGLVIAWISGIVEPRSLLPMSGANHSDPALPHLGIPTPIPPLIQGRVLEEKTFAETDLNCDGQMERIVISTGTSPRGMYIGVLEVRLEAVIDGKTDMVWKVNTTDLQTSYLFQPQLILPSEDSCSQLLALPIDSSHNIFGDLLVFRWNGTRMETILNAPGLPALDPAPPGSITTVQRFAGDEEDGTCSWTLTTYEWNGNRFEEVSRREQEVSCDNFNRTQPTGEIFQAIGDISIGRFVQFLAQTDLNCDGRFERLLVERSPQSIYEYVSPRIYRVLLEASEKTAWELASADPLSYYFGPEWFSVGGCEHFLAVIEYPATSIFGRLHVYRWEGEKMLLVLDSPGLPATPNSSVNHLVQQPGQPFTITTIEIGTIEVEPGWCENIVHTYQWDGNAFIETEKVPIRVKCGN